jgi:DNA-binding MltR family transcriptional regulator
MAHERLSTDQLKEQVKMLYEVLSGEPPLPCALIAGAYLDKAVITLLTSFFISGSTANEICDENKGVLRDSASRAKIAYVLGLIPKDAYQNLVVIARVRNMFAHSHAMIDFDDERIISLCDSLKLPEAPGGNEDFAFMIQQGKYSKPARLLFECAVVNTVQQILAQASQVIRQKDCESVVIFSSLSALLDYLH